ncbi:MAG: carbohydrate ABC transporter permease [Verrucomicrobiae bacterium]|nr:carbohydrate ABC transporter permease [Verrucomicrobiae bacterium]
MRVTLALMYLLLVTGSITMIGPFLLMLAGSISNEADVSDYRIVPKFLYDDTALFARFLNDKYYNDLSALKDLYRYELSRVDVRTGTVAEMARQLRLREQATDPAMQRLVAAYGEFLAYGISTDCYQAGFLSRGGLVGPVNRGFQAWLQTEFASLTDLNRAIDQSFDYWAEVSVPVELISSRDWAPVYHSRYRLYLRYKPLLPVWQRVPFEGTRKWIDHLRFVADGNIARLNERLGTQYRDFSDISLPPSLPNHPLLAELWEDFVRRKWPLRLLEINEGGLQEYRSYLKARRGSIAQLNATYGTNYRSFDEVPWPTGEMLEGIRQSDLLDFLRDARADLPRLSIRNVTLRNATVEFRRWLLREYGGSLEEINRRLGTQFGRLDDIVIPHAVWEWKEVTDNPGAWRWYFIRTNYVEVFSFIFTKGRALINTVIYILLAIVITLTVNPLCAYALSRFNLSYAYKVLLFLLATMAFPAEVTMIPNFLLLRDLGLLNTFAALVLPGMANGFSIFILKGFFDTLPRELYEAGQLDGASELRMFYQITVPLCKPVFAYIALITFTAAYGAFLFALTVCQDPNMWTLMVWLYDLNATAPEHIRVAALVVAMIPTLLVFVSCQRVIMRGIVLPQMN